MIDCLNYWNSGSVYMGYVGTEILAHLLVPPLCL